MSVRAVLLVTIALAASGAASVPLFIEGPMVQIDLPMLASSAGGHAGHGGGHAAHPSNFAKNAPGHAGHGAAGSGEATEVHGAHSADAAGASAAGTDPHAAHGGDHADLGDQPGMQRPSFPPASGKVPSSPDGLQQMPTLRVLGDDDLAELAPTGSGTLSDPYLLTGLYYPGELDLRDTDACVVLTGNYFGGQLALSWNGQCVWAHHNYIRDLRVNENNARTGYVTGGLIEHNEIGVIGQLRHYDGEFRHNVVGPAAPDMLFDPVYETTPLLFGVELIANIDGFNQGHIHHNTFYGTVDLDLHGHHHGTGFFAPHSHYHGDSSTRQAEHMHDHTDRWTSVAFTDNVIVDAKGYGLRYEDQNHAGDDRRANSEEMDVLNDPHTHHTDIVLARNRVTGGQIWVDVFNADDRNHKTRNPGTLTIADNVVTTHERDRPSGQYCFFWFDDPYTDRAAIHVSLAKEVETRILDNVLTYVPLASATNPVSLVKGAIRDVQEACAPTSATAVRFDDIRDADLLVEGNTARGFAVGVGAQSMDGKTFWRVVGNDFDAFTKVAYDDSVANKPETS